MFHFNWHKKFTRYILSPIFILFTFCACGYRTEEALIPDARIDASVNNEVSTIDVSANDSGCEIGEPFYGYMVQYFGDCSRMTRTVILCTTDKQFPAGTDCIVRLSDGAVFTITSIPRISETEWKRCTKEEYLRAWNTPSCLQDAGVGDAK
jgi:hypothetical protein